LDLFQNLVCMSWKTENNKLVKEFEFENFLMALEFVNKVGKVAEEFGHHPEIWFTWGRVKISTTTHDAGDQVTQKDMDLSKLIDGIG
jgi:4a-hydroxytetrahydrobiopterin dehydratase